MKQVKTKYRAFLESFRVTMVTYYAKIVGVFCKAITDVSYGTIKIAVA